MPRRRWAASARGRARIGGTSDGVIGRRVTDDAALSRVCMCMSAREREREGRGEKTERLPDRCVSMRECDASRAALRSY